MMTTATKIKIELLKKGVSGAEIARKEGVDRTAIYHVIKGDTKSPRLRKAIAEAVELPVEALWGEPEKKAA